MAADGWRPGERGRIAVLGIGLLGAVLLPLRQHLRPAGQRVDGFPISYYPMFSKRRQPTVRVVYVVGVRADGSRHYLAHEVLNSGGLNQVRHQLHRAAVTDRSPGRYLDALVARHEGGSGLDGLERLELVRGRFNLDDCMLGDQVSAEDEMVLARTDLTAFPVAVTALPVTPAAFGTPPVAGTALDAVAS